MAYSPAAIVDDWLVTGGATRSALNDNLLVASGSAAYDTFQAANGLGTARSMYLQVTGSSGISSGQIIIEGSNDNSTFVTLIAFDDSAIFNSPLVSAASIAASATKFYSCKLAYRYLRVRISTAFVGGTVSAVARFGTPDYVTRMTNAFQQNTGNQLLAIATLSPRTSGGNTPFTAALLATATQVKSGAGQVYGYDIHNPNAAISYVQFFNTAVGSVTVGTTTPVYVVGIPANSTARMSIEHGLAFSTAIVVAGTTTRSGNTAPGSALDVNVVYT